VGVVHHDRRAVGLGQFDDLGQRGDVPVHAEDPVGHHQDPAGAAAAGLGEPLLQAWHVLVGEEVTPRLGEPDPVDDAGVVELVADHGVGLT